MNKSSNRIIHGKCHCGKVQFQTVHQPEWLVECNCSSCSRIGAKWSHTEMDKVQFNYLKQDSIRYIWGDKCLAIISCKHCGCTTHWESLNDDSLHEQGVGLNFRMCDAAESQNLRLRQFDGANSWEFLD